MTDLSKNRVIIVIDDDEIIRLSCEQILQKAGYSVETYDNGHEGIERLKVVNPALAVVDIKMPELDGFQVINLVRKIDPDIVIVVITGYATIETAVDAMKAGAYDFLPKPFTPSELRLIIDRGFERWRLTKEAQHLRRAKEEVERKFVTLVSHQLKGPIGVVKQYLDVLLYTSREQLPERALEWITRSQARLGDMLTIIQDWLALARIDRGTFCERTTASDLGQIVENIVREQQQLPGAASISISISSPADLSLVCGDLTSLGMLVGNLVGNAIKYNRPGGAVSVALHNDGAWVELEVHDTGIGIPKECIPHLFEEFYRAKRPETQDIPGTGLGLVICKKITSELGGSINVESKEGLFTRFLVRLPAAQKKPVRDFSEANDSKLGLTMQTTPGESK
jgi:two-component system, sensor histidine kinase and response regulator